MIELDAVSRINIQVVHLVLGVVSVCITEKQNISLNLVWGLMHRLSTALVSASTNRLLGILKNLSVGLRTLNQIKKSLLKGAHAKALKHPYCSKLVTIFTAHSTRKQTGQFYIKMCSSVWNRLLGPLIMVRVWLGQISQKQWDVCPFTTIRFFLKVEKTQLCLELCTSDFTVKTAFNV